MDKIFTSLELEKIYCCVMWQLGKDELELMRMENINRCFTDEESEKYDNLKDIINFYSDITSRLKKLVVVARLEDKK